MDPNTGTATGELREPPAAQSFRDLIPPPTEDQKRTQLKMGLQQAAELGITSIHNMDNRHDQLHLYAAMQEAGELTLRIYQPFDMNPDTPLD